MANIIGFAFDKEVERQKLTVFQLDYEIPEMSIDEIVLKYKQTGDTMYFGYFLHCYEDKLNQISMFWCRKLYMPQERFGEIKQVIADTYSKCLDKFDPLLAVPFFAYAQPSIKATIFEYAAKSAGALSCGSTDTFKAVRKAQAIKSRLVQNQISENDIVNTIAEEMKITTEHVLSFLNLGADYKGIKSTDTIFHEDTNGNVSAYESFLHDTDADTEQLALRQMLMDEVNDIIETKLSEKQKMILLDSLGICPHCYKGTKTKTYGDIAEDYDLFSESAIEKSRKEAIRIIRTELVKRGWM